MKNLITINDCLREFWNHKWAYMIGDGILFAVILLVFYLFFPYTYVSTISIQASSEASVSGNTELEILDGFVVDMGDKGDKLPKVSYESKLTASGDVIKTKFSCTNRSALQAFQNQFVNQRIPALKEYIAHTVGADAANEVAVIDYQFPKPLKRGIDMLADALLVLILTHSVIIVRVMKRGVTADDSI